MLDTSYIESCKKAIHGYLYGKVDDLDFTTPKYFSEELSVLKQNKNFMEILQESAGVIEYIDSTESENALIGRDMKSFTRENTHCEIHILLLC